jgi:hypothetical protein
MPINLSGSLVLTGSLTVTGEITMSGSIASASYALSSSYAANSDLLDNRDSLTFANTGSNTFVGNQTITGSIFGSGSLTINGCITSTGQIVAQTINVQQVTSSIVYSCGSNIFGTTVSNTQQLTGSVGVTGSLTLIGPMIGSSTACFGGNITTVGCIGIGTNSAATPLHIVTTGLPAIRLTLGSEARCHNINGVNLGRDLQVLPFRHFSVQAGNGIAEGQIVLNAYEDFIVGTGASYTPRLTITPTGIATFACRVCAPNINLSNSISINACSTVTVADWYNTNTDDGNGLYIKAGGVNSGKYVMALENAAGASRMIVLANGNVGIGTTSPGARLQVAGCVEANGSLYRAVFGTTVQDADMTGLTGGNASEVQIQASSISRGAYLTLGGGMNFGEAMGGIAFYNSNNVDGKRNRAFIVGGQEGATAGEQGSYLSFGTVANTVSVPSERIRINSTGNVGIGTTSLSTEANLFLGAQGSIEGGQMVLQKGTSCNCATHLDNYNDSFRIMSGTDTGSNMVNMTVNHATGTVGISKTLSITTTALHGIKTFESGATSAFTINLPVEYPNLLLTGGNVWGVVGKALFFNGGSAEVRDFYIARNSGGSWSTANYGPSSNTSGGILQSVAGSGTCITINMNSNSYVTVELTTMVR